MENFSYLFNSFITSYVDRPNVNEYVEDGFLVDDDAPIEYETQFTQSSSLNMPTLVSTRDSLFPYSDNEDSGRSHRRQGPSIQQIEREEREAQSVASHRVRRRKRAMVLSDEEDSIEDEEPSVSSSVSLSSSTRPSCKFPVDVRLPTILLVFQMTCLPRTSLQIAVSLCSLEVTPSFKRLYSVSFSRLLRMIRIRKGGRRELFQSLHRRSDEAVSCRRPCSLWGFLTSYSDGNAPIFSAVTIVCSVHFQ